VEIPQEYIVESKFHDPRGSGRATRKLLALPDPPSCILYPDDISFLGGMSELERQGLKIPTDISVAGYDGISLSQLLRPSLTTMHQDSAELGAAAARRLIRAIEDPQTDFPDQTLIAGTLIPGQTVRSLL
jgi:LacI family transcriptional regulator